MKFDSGQVAQFRLDDSDNPGYARVKVLSEIETAQAKTIKTFTGHDLYKIEVLAVVKPSFARPKLKAGKTLEVSAKHLSFCEG